MFTNVKNCTPIIIYNLRTSSLPAQILDEKV